MDASWTRVGTLILGAGGNGGPGAATATDGGDTSWPAITYGSPPTYIISGGTKGGDYTGAGVGGAGGVSYISNYLFTLGVDGWRAMGKANGPDGQGTIGSGQGGVGGGSGGATSPGSVTVGAVNSLAFAPGAGGYPAVAGEDGQFGTGGGGGGNTGVGVGRYGGNGGDACMFIEWWL